MLWTRAEMIRNFKILFRRYFLYSTSLYQLCLKILYFILMTSYQEKLETKIWDNMTFLKITKVLKEVFSFGNGVYTFAQSLILIENKLQLLIP